MKVEEKRRLKKKEIISAALESWGETEFNETSLNLVAQKIGMTKQSIYRYFKNKEELINEIIESNINKIDQEREVIFEKIDAIDEENKLSYIFKEMGENQINNREIINFFAFVSKKRQAFVARPLIEKMFKALQNNLKLKPIDCLLIIFLTDFFWSEKRMGDLLKKRSNQEKIDLACNIIQTGVFPSYFEVPCTISLDFFEKEIEHFKDKIKKNPLHNAIFKAIEESGLQGITLENIANHAGLCKSSLYNYYDTKEQLIYSLTKDLIQNYIKCHKKILDNFNSFEEKLYIHIKFQLEMFPYKPQILYVIQEVVNQYKKIQRPIDSPSFTSFLDDGIQSKKLKNSLNSIEYQLLFGMLAFIEKIVLPETDLVQNSSDGALNIINYVNKNLNYKEIK